ncbi:MAG: hypothetical protein RLY86_8 [Pseudomonadota bacterium]|jgi:diguanylate cyclase (GGDEF)-like protein
MLPRALTALFALVVIAVTTASAGRMSVAQDVRAQQAALPDRAGLDRAGSDGAAPDWATLATPVFRRIGPEDGLVNAMVANLAQDGAGFVWAATQGGLARIEGQRIRFFRHDPEDPRSLPQDFVNDLHVDREGRLWLATVSGRVARFDAATQDFIQYAAPPAGLGSSPRLAHDADGTLWSGSLDGLYRLDEGAGAWVRIDGKGVGLPDDPLAVIMFDRDGTAWVRTTQGLFRRPVGTDRFQPVEGSRGSRIAWIINLADGGIAFGKVMGEIMRVAPGAAVAVPIAQLNTGRLTFDGVARSADGRLWIGTDGGGLIVLDPVSGKVREIRHDPSKAPGLPDGRVWSVMVDRSGLLWVGTTVGIGVTDPGADAVLSLLPGQDRSRGLKHASVGAILPIGADRVWIGYRPEGARTLGRDGLGEAMISGLPLDASVLDFARGRDGDLWIGTDRGLFIAPAAADAGGGGATTDALSVHPVRPVTALGATFVERLLPLGDRMWVGTWDGLSELDRTGQVLRSFRPSPTAAAGTATGDASPSPGGLSDPYVIDLLADPGGGIWVATARGINHLDPATGIIRSVPLLADGDAGEVAPWVSSLLLDRLGRLWVGTLGAGIAVLEDRLAPRPVIRRIGTRQGLGSANIALLLADAAGRIWASSHGGLAVIDPDSLQPRTLGPADGLATGTFWVGSGAALPDGTLAFGGIGGVTIVRPDQLTAWEYRPAIAVTDLRIAGASVPLGGQAILNPGQRSLEVEFAALDHSAPRQNRYAYRLDGYDVDWVEADPVRPVASYTNLPPGVYTLHLRGSNRNGVWSDPPTTLTVEVLPAWYQTYWAQAAGILLLILLGTGVVQVRTAMLRQRQRDLEGLVALRTRELQDSHAALERIAFLDDLTGLPNRRLFNQEISLCFARARRSGDPFALVLVDLDGFKLINDSYGHMAGDIVLTHVADRLRHVLRETDRVARLGGDEFALLLDACDRDGVETICARIIAAMADPVVIAGTGLRVGLSLGGAVGPADGDTAEQLYRAADLALYQSKQAGGGTWNWYRMAARERA